MNNLRQISSHLMECAPHSLIQSTHQSVQWARHSITFFTDGPELLAQHPNAAIAVIGTVNALFYLTIYRMVIQIEKWLGGHQNQKSNKYFVIRELLVAGSVGALHLLLARTKVQLDPLISLATIISIFTIRLVMMSYQNRGIAKTDEQTTTPQASLSQKQQSSVSEEDLEKVPQQNSSSTVTSQDNKSKADPQNQVGKLMTEQKALQERYDELNSELKKARSEKIHANADLALLKSQDSTLLKERDKAIAQITELDVLIQQLREEKTTLLETVQEIETEKQDLKKKLSVSIAAQGNTPSSEPDTNDQILGLQGEIADLKENLSTITDENNDLNNQLAILNASLNTAKNDKNSVDAQYAALQQLHNHLSQANASELAKNVTLTARIGQLETQRDVLNNDLVASSARIDALQSAEQAAQAQIDKINDSLRVLQAAQDALTRTNAQLEAQKARADERAEKAEQNKEQTEQEFVKYKELADQTENQLRDDLSQANSAKLAMTDKIKTFTAERNMLEEELGKADEDITKLQTQAIQLRSELIDSDDLIQKLTLMIAQHENNPTLIDALNTLKDDQSTSKQQAFDVVQSFVPETDAAGSTSTASSASSAVIATSSPPDAPVSDDKAASPPSSPRQEAALPKTPTRDRAPAVSFSTPVQQQQMPAKSKGSPMMDKFGPRLVPRLNPQIVAASVGFVPKRTPASFRFGMGMDNPSAKPVKRNADK